MTKDEIPSDDNDDGGLEAGGGDGGLQAVMAACGTGGNGSDGRH